MVDEDLRVISEEEVGEHNSEDSIWITMNGKVYDVTKFLYEHPGGEDVILQQAGCDATEAFSDAGHSTDAIEMTKEYLIGYLPGSEPKGESPNDAKDATSASESSWTSSTLITYLLPVITVTIGIWLSYKLTQSFVKV